MNIELLKEIFNVNYTQFLKKKKFKHLKKEKAKKSVLQQEFLST